jgi:hypothetical protein
MSWRHRRRGRQVLYAVAAHLMLDGGAVPWEAAVYQDMTARQRLRWLRSHPYTAARVDPVGLDAAARRRLHIVARLDTSQEPP